MPSQLKVFILLSTFEYSERYFSSENDWSFYSNVGLISIRVLHAKSNSDICMHEDNENETSNAQSYRSLRLILAS